MFDQLFDRPSAVSRYRTGPMLEERIAFLKYLANEGYTAADCGIMPVICV